MENSKINYESIFGSEDYLNLLRITDGMLHTEDGHTFEIHRGILYKSSTYFHGLFCGISGVRNEYWIPGISGEILSDILRYIYTGNISLSNTKVAELMTAADYLLLDDLLDIVLKYAHNNITHDNCFSIYLAAEKITAKDVQRTVFRFIQMHFEEIIHNSIYGYTELPVEVVKQLLHCKTLKITNERSVWLAIIMWIKKDVQRLPYVPDLLMCLSPGEIDEELAKDIMEHSIVANNPACENLQVEKSASSSEYRDIFLVFIQNRSVRPEDIHFCRISPRMHLITHFCVNGYKDYSDVYISYDGNLDFWRKITEIDIHPNYLFPFAHNIYMLESKMPNILTFDLIDKRKINMDEHFNTEELDIFDAFKIGQYIYIIENSYDIDSYSEIYSIKGYDTLTNDWLAGASLSGIDDANFTSTSKKIYAVGSTPDGNNLVAMVYDPVLDTWSPLPSPRIQRLEPAFIALHESLFLIGGHNINDFNFLRNVEKFDPVNYVWTELPDLPYDFNSSPTVNVVNDILIVYGVCDLYNHVTRGVRWNEGKICWEKLEEQSLFEDLNLYQFCSLQNAEVIRNLWNENRNSDTKFEKSPFCTKEVFTEEDIF